MTLSPPLTKSLDEQSDFLEEEGREVKLPFKLINDSPKDLGKLKVNVAHQFSEMIRERREQRGIILEQLSEATGLSVSSLSRIENKMLSPKLVDSILICKALNIPLHMVDLIAEKKVVESEKPLETIDKIAMVIENDIQFSQEQKQKIMKTVQSVFELAT